MGDDDLSEAASSTAGNNSPAPRSMPSAAALLLADRPLTAKTQEQEDDDDHKRADHFLYDLHTNSSSKRPGHDSKLKEMHSGITQNNRGIKSSDADSDFGASSNLSLSGTAVRSQDGLSLADVPTAGPERGALVAKGKHMADLTAQMDADDDDDDQGEDLMADDDDEDDQDSAVQNESLMSKHSYYAAQSNSPGAYAKDASGHTELEDLQSLFGLVTQYKPEPIELPTVLHCFLPDYIPAIGDLEAMIKIPTPAFYSDGSKPADPQLGLVIVDEPSSKQSDPAVLHYSLRTVAKASLSSSSDKASVVHALDLAGPDSASSKRQLDDWIESTSSGDWGTARITSFAPTKRYSDPDLLMDAWDAELEPVIATEVESGGFSIADIDLSLAQCAQLTCALLDIPCHATSSPDKSPSRNGKGAPAAVSSSKSLIESLHVLFDLYAGFNQNAHFVSGMDISSSTQGMFEMDVGSNSNFVGGLDSGRNSGRGRARMPQARTVQRGREAEMVSGLAPRRLDGSEQYIATNTSSPLSVRTSVSVTDDQQVLSIAYH
ncbi:hypothetical protein RI367_007238 [Sorochytrium milnesiophthora]